MHDERNLDRFGALDPWYKGRTVEVPCQWLALTALVSFALILTEDGPDPGQWSQGFASMDTRVAVDSVVRRGGVDLQLPGEGVDARTWPSHWSCCCCDPFTPSSALCDATSGAGGHVHCSWCGTTAEKGNEHEHGGDRYPDVEKRLRRLRNPEDWDDMGWNQASRRPPPAILSIKAGRDC